MVLRLTSKGLGAIIPGRCWFSPQQLLIACCYFFKKQFMNSIQFKSKHQLYSPQKSISTFSTENPTGQLCHKFSTNVAPSNCWGQCKPQWQKIDTLASLIKEWSRGPVVCFSVQDHWLEKRKNSTLSKELIYDSTV